MKTSKLFFTLSVLLSSFSFGQSNNATKPATTKVIQDGIYAIVNIESDDALTPLMLSAGQNVYCKPYQKNNDLQKWEIKKAGKYYTIKCTESDDLYFQPFPSSNHTAIVSIEIMNTDNKFTLELNNENEQEYIYIKSVKMGKQALCEIENASTNEAHFKTNEMSANFKWKLIKVAK